MRRLIRLGDWTQVDARPDCAVVTPNENAAITLGTPHISLEHLARGILDEERIAHPLIVQRLLREAVEEVLGSTDLGGVAHTLLPPIRELFRAGAELGNDPGSRRG